MSLIDAATVPHDATMSADVCIIGSGAAGLALATELADSPLQVVVLESGGLGEEDPQGVLEEIDCIGYPMRTAGVLRRRGFGGSTSVWYGRLTPLDETALAAWPIGSAALQPYAARAARFLHAPHLVTRSWLPDPRDPGAVALTSPELQATMQHWGRRKRLGRVHLPALRAASRVSIVLGGRARKLEAGDGRQSVTSAMVQSRRGNAFRVRSRSYVLAGGGLENARLLLLSGLGNDHDVVGRYYMNHPRLDGVGRLVLDPGRPRVAALLRSLTVRFDPRAFAWSQLSVAASGELRQRTGILNCGSFFYRVSTEPLRRATERARSLRVRDVLSAVPVLTRAAIGRSLRSTYELDHLALVDQVEQAPDPQSRISLSSRRDRYGDPIVSVDWAIGPRETESLRVLHRAIASRVRESGIGRLDSHLLSDPNFVPAYTDAAHPMGTTRMSDDPHDGVVDSHCRVHGVANLFVAGSSVFPAGGHTAPTLTIVMLALRLADHLRGASRD